MKKLSAILSAALVLFSGCGGNDMSRSDSSAPLEETSSESISLDETADSGLGDKPTLIWLTAAPMRYQDDLNEYLDEAGYDFHISFRAVNEDSAQFFDADGNMTSDYWDSCYQARSINAAEHGADIIDTKDWLENAYLSYAEKGLLEPLDGYLTLSESGKALYAGMPECYWENLRYNGMIYGVDSYLACMQSDIDIRLNNELCTKLGITAEDISEDYLEALDDIAKICQENGLVFGVQSLDTLSSWVDCEFITDCIYIDENGNAANIYESDFAHELFERIAANYNSGCFVSTYDCMSAVTDKVLGWTRSSIAARVKNGFVSSEQFGIETRIGRVPALSVCHGGHSRLSSNVSVTGICRGSEHKALAFEALCAFMTDEKFINTLTYGKDCTVKGGCALYEEYGGMPMGNAVLQLSIEGNAPADRGQKLLSALEGYGAGRYSGFYFDTQGVRDQLIGIYNITSRVNDEFIAPRNWEAEAVRIDGREYLDSLNERLYAAGLQEVIDEANRQLGEAK